MRKTSKSKIVALLLLCSTTFLTSTCFMPRVNASTEILGFTLYNADDVKTATAEFNSRLERCKEKIVACKKIAAKDANISKFEDRIEDLESSVLKAARSAYFYRSKFAALEDGKDSASQLEKKIARYLQELQEKPQPRDPKQIEAKQNEEIAAYKEALIKTVDSKVEQLDSYLKELGDDATSFDGEMAAIKNKALGIKNNICNTVISPRMRNDDSAVFSANLEKVFENIVKEIDSFNDQTSELLKSIGDMMKELKSRIVNEAKDEFHSWLEEKRRYISEQFSMGDLDGNYDGQAKLDSLKKELLESIESLNNKINQLSDVDQVKRFETSQRLFEKKCSRCVSIKNKVVDEYKKKIQSERKLIDIHDFDKQCDMLREGTLSLDEVVGGYDNIKNDVHTLLEQHRAAARLKDKIKPSKGMILYGKPGTGKTTMVKAMAAAEKCDIVVLKKHTENGNDNMVSEIKSKFKYAKDLASNRRNEVDENGNKNNENAIVVLLIDEIDALAGHRQDIPTNDSATTKETVTLLSELDELKPSDGVVILATTNLPLAVDPAVRRSERLEQSVEVATPSESDLYKILMVNLNGYRLEEGQTIKSMATSLAGKFRGKTGADITRAIELAVQQKMTESKSSLLIDVILYKKDIEKIIRCC